MGSEWITKALDGAREKASGLPLELREAALRSGTASTRPFSTSAPRTISAPETPLAPAEGSERPSSERPGEGPTNP